MGTCRTKFDHMFFLDPHPFWLMAADTITFTVVCQEHTQMLDTRNYSSEKYRVFHIPQNALKDS